MKWTLRPEEETNALFIDTKYYNEVVKILIDNYDTLFSNLRSGYKGKFSLHADQNILQQKNDFMGETGAKYK